MPFARQAAGLEFRGGEEAEHHLHNCDADDVVSRLERLLEIGVVKRFGLVVRHRELGYRATHTIDHGITEVVVGRGHDHHPLGVTRRGGDRTVDHEVVDGGLALDKDVYVFRYSCQMATMDMDEFEVPLHVVASTADRLEQEFSTEDTF